METDMKFLNVLGIAALLAVSSAGLAETDTGHFSPKGKLPSKYTIEKQQQQRKILPFADKRDFEEQSKGFIAAPDYTQIMAEK
ncbi:MAG: MBL fold metallo-hydrolase, partial [Gammaproteobacteria bacterium]